MAPLGRPPDMLPRRRVANAGNVPGNPTMPLRDRSVRPDNVEELHIVRGM